MSAPDRWPLAELNRPQLDGVVLRLRVELALVRLSLAELAHPDPGPGYRCGGPCGRCGVVYGPGTISTRHRGGFAGGPVLCAGCLEADARELRQQIARALRARGLAGVVRA